MKTKTIPKHVGLIPDGTRRWAKERNDDLEIAYKLSMDNIGKFIRLMFNSGIKKLSIFLLSKENLSRHPSEVTAVYKGEIYFFETVMPEILTEYEVKIIPVGQRDLCEKKFSDALDQLCKQNNTHYDKTIYLLIAYNPIDEICSLSERYLNSDTLLKLLWVPESLDLVIRTGGQKRISNFLPLQIGFAELIFLSKNFNDLIEEDWKNCLTEFSLRKRRFGK